MEILQDDRFMNFAQLWKDCQSVEKNLPYYSQMRQHEDSRFNTIKTLMNMIFISLEKMESQTSPPSSQPRTQCRTCPMLRADLIKSEEEMGWLREECSHLYRQLGDVQLQPQPQSNENKNLDGPGELKNSEMLPNLDIDMGTPEIPPDMDIDMENPDILPGTPPQQTTNRKRSRAPLSHIKKFHNDENNQMKKPRPTTNTHSTSRSNSNSNELQKSGRQGREGSEGKKHLVHQTTTLRRSFSTAKNRVPIPMNTGNTVDLTTQVYERGQKNCTATTAVKNNYLKKSETSHVENLSSFPLKKKTDETGYSETMFDPDEDETETMFIPPAPTSTKSSSNSGVRATTTRREFGNETLEMLKNFDKLPNNDSPSPDFAYKPERAIRKRDERAKLPGWDCDMCREYYAALGSQMSKDQIQNVKNNCSRHRAKYPPNLDGTPPNYWDLDFPSTEECIEKGFMGEGRASPSVFDFDI